MQLALPIAADHVRERPATIDPEVPTEGGHVDFPAGQFHDDKTSIIRKRFVDKVAL